MPAKKVSDFSSIQIIHELWLAKGANLDDRKELFINCCYKPICSPMIPTNNSNYIVFSFCLCLLGNTYGQWKPAGEKIRTKWADEIDTKNVLNEYPRPLMVREQWKNLNGLWNYAITGKGEPCPINFEGTILVPFAVESSLS